MSSEKLLEDLRDLFQTFREWPEPTIGKTVLIQHLKDLEKQNPELENTYESLTTSFEHSNSRHGLTFSDSSTDEVDSQSSSKIDEQNKINENDQPLARGDLTIGKGSALLSTFSKKDGLDIIVYCELSYVTNDNNEKIVYFTVYKDKRSSEVLKQFIIDHNCSFVEIDKQNFEFKHNSDIEYFTIEEGVVDTWISSLNQLICHNSIPKSSSEQSPIPENIYVCLYDHHSTTNNPHELEFKCGDILYIVNKSGENFYIGYKFEPPWNDYKQNPIGFVFKDYITPAYEKTLSSKRI